MTPDPTRDALRHIAHPQRNAHDYTDEGCRVLLQSYINLAREALAAADNDQQSHQEDTMGHMPDPSGFSRRQDTRSISLDLSRAQRDELARALEAETLPHAVADLARLAVHLYDAIGANRTDPVTGERTWDA